MFNFAQCAPGVEGAGSPLYREGGAAIPTVYRSSSTVSDSSGFKRFAFRRDALDQIIPGLDERGGTFVLEL